MGISTERAQQLITTLDEYYDAMFDMDNPRHLPIERDLSLEKINVRQIAKSLQLEPSQFSTYIEDDDLWIVFGGNIVEGIPGEGPTPEFAIADFYRRWYTDVVVKQKPVLMNDNSYFTWQGEAH